MLWLALRLPQLPLDVFSAELAQANDDSEDSSPVKKNTADKPPLLVYHNLRGSKKILHSNDTAEALGVRKTMSLVTAEALLQAQLEEQASRQSEHPTEHQNEKQNELNAEPSEPASIKHPATTLTNPPYHCFERDLSREWVALQQLAAVCYDFTPHVSIHNPPPLSSSTPGQSQGGNNKTGTHNRDAGLLLEISGSLKLFKGLARLCQLLQQQLQPWQCFVQIGIGPTAEGAWLISHSRYLPGDHYNEHDYLQHLGHIHLTKIDCFTEAFGQLSKMGLAQLQQVLAMPMVELGRRFGEAFIHYLYALTGKHNNALVRKTEACEFCSRVQLNHPVTNLQQLQPVVTSLLQQLIQFLRREQQQCEAIEWQLLAATGEKKTVPVVCQPVHSDWQLLQQLTSIHFDHLSINFEVDSVELVATQHSHFNQETGDLFAADPELALNQQEVLRRWQLLLTRLHNRLGNSSTLELNPLPEHWPEQLNHWQTSEIKNGKNKAAVAEPQVQYQADDNPLAPRPSWLINPPVVLKERGHQLFWRGPLTLLLGPERLQGQWWLPGDNQCRDYFIAEQDDYRRVWVYHDAKQKQWFLQGVFG